jgi:hypothetical protein
MILFCLLSLPFFLLPWLSLAQDPFHIQLKRRNKAQARSIDYVQEAERLRFRYGFAKPSNATFSIRAATVGIPITNQVCCHG